MRFALLVLALCGVAVARENGLARTPPMGWLSWTRFGCNVSEKLLKSQADAMVKLGYKDAGYQYVIVDDCWLEKTRDPETNKLRPDHNRFPSGMKALADYIHDKGLKFGVYNAVGNKTCQGYPGLQHNFELDAQTFVDWGVDYVKIDGCDQVGDKELNYGYPAFGDAIAKTGTEMVYSCEWPLYLHGPKDFQAVQDTCNLWRNGGDLDDSFGGIKYQIDYYVQNVKKMGPHIGPGAWNDLDMMSLGNYGLSYDESQVCFGMWAMLQSPMLMSTQLNDVSDEIRELLQNKDVIAVNQDPLGLMPKIVKYDRNGISVYLKHVTPVHQGIGSYVLAITNFATIGTTARYPLTLRSVGVTDDCEDYWVVDILNDDMIHSKATKDTDLTALVNPSGIIMWKITPHELT